MNGKKSKFNFTPKKTLSKKNPNLQIEKTKTLYQNNSGNKKQNKYYKYNKILNYNKPFLTDITNNTERNNRSNNSNIINYLEGIHNKNINNGDKQKFLDEDDSDWEESKNNSKEKNYYIKANNNSSEMKYLIKNNEKEEIDFITTLLKLKGIKSFSKDIKDYDDDEKYLSSIRNHSSTNDSKKPKKCKDKINKKQLRIYNITNKDFSKELNRFSGKNLTENNSIKNYSSRISKIKKIKERNKDKHINKTLSSKKKRKCVQEVSINLLDSDESNTKIYKNNKKPKEKSFERKTCIKTFEKKFNFKLNTIKEKYKNKSPDNNIFKNKKIFGSKNLGLKVIKNGNHEEKKTMNKKNNTIIDKKIENGRNNRRKKSDEIIKTKSIDNKNKRGTIKDNIKNIYKKELKKPKKYYNNKIKNNYNNNDSKKRPKVQNHIFSVIDEIDEDAKADTLDNSNKNKNKDKENNKNINNVKNKENNKEDNKTNKSRNEHNSSKIIKLIPSESIQSNNNRYGIKNNNISIVLNDTFSNELCYNDKKLGTSFLSSSTFNNDLVNYKPSEKNTSNCVINNNNNNFSNNITNNTMFSIINNSNINNDNPNNQNMSIMTQTNNNNSLQVTSDVIHLNPENEEKINFSIENNSKLINEIDQNDISDIMPLENKDMDFKINIYDNSKSNTKEQKNNINNETSKDNSSGDEEGESIINHFDIINNQIQNESKEIKLSQIKNNDNFNNSNSNINISITNLSKLTNFVDSNIKYGELSHMSSKINNKNVDIRKNSNKNIEKIKESLLNSNNNNNNNNSNSKNNGENNNEKQEITIKRIEHKKIKKNTKKQINKNNCDETKSYK